MFRRTRVARRLAARDTDPGDEVTGWAIVGGADRSEFSIASDTGELSFREAPDYEAPGDNQYVVTVEVRSGAGARELDGGADVYDQRDRRAGTAGSAGGADLLGGDGRQL